MIEVTVKGHPIQLFYYFQSINSIAIGNRTYDNLCKKGDLWEISFAPGTFKSGLIASELVNSLEAVRTQLGTSVRPSVRIEDLPSGVSGEEQAGEIVLSSALLDGTGFVDFTPGDNSEFLPTANSSEWIAKPNGSAAGKIDLDTVLLHEYGHALGLDHSPDSHDFMAATLTAG